MYVNNVAKDLLPVNFAKFTPLRILTDRVVASMHVVEFKRGFAA